MSTKNWCEFVESYCLIQPGGKGRVSSSMLRRLEGGMPLRVLCCEALLAEGPLDELPAVACS